MIAGLITTVLSCFPLVFMKLLDYVAIYGLVLMPIGAVVFAEHWIFPWLGLPQYRTERRGQAFNWPALIVWAGTLLLCFFMPFHLFFRWLPGYFDRAGLLHPDEPGAPERGAAGNVAAAHRRGVPGDGESANCCLALISLLACLVAPVLLFNGVIDARNLQACPHGGHRRLVRLRDRVE